MTDITERAKAVREALAFTDLLDGELDLANEVIDALIAEVRRLRAAIAAVDEINRNLRVAVREDAYNCRCQVGGVDAMSIDTDWLKRITADINTALHPQEPDHA